jgi:hypothetical protein
MTWDPKDAEEFMVSNGWKPVEPYPGTNTPWKSIHIACGVEGSPRMYHIQGGRVACQPCGKKSMADAQRHTDESTVPIMQKAGWEPLEPYKGNKDLWKSKCMSCGREGTPTFNNVHTHGSKCGFCNGNKVDIDDAWEIMRAASLEPQEEYPGAGVPWKSKCLICENFTYPRFADVKYGIRCSTCAESGINFSQPSYFYIMKNDSLNSIKVGISNDDSNSNRIKHHKRFGWAPIRQFNFDTGKQAAEIENLVLRWIRKEKMLGVHLSSELMPQGGFSETVDADEITTEEIVKFVEHLILLRF